MKSEFTKGAWEARLTGNSRQVGDNYEIISPTGTGKSHYRIARVTNFHDARLIAQAPKLYEACLCALGVMATLDQNKGWVKKISDKIQQALAPVGGE